MSGGTFSIFEEIDARRDAARFGEPRRPPRVADTLYPAADGTRVALPTFEIGLVLAGAVSAGAYSAGVLDFLVETLDRWERAKEEAARVHGDRFADWPVPPHAVRLRVVAGASAGSVCAAAFAVASGGIFPPGSGLDPGVQPQSPLGPDGAPPIHPNPLYNIWVRQLDIRGMLATADLHDHSLAEVASLLNVTPLDRAAGQAATAALPPPPPRRWLAAGVRYGFTFANLTGAPYLYQLAGLEGADFATTRHADIYRFRVLGPDEPRDALPDGCEPGVPLVEGAIAESVGNWREIADAALASGAFPIALKPRMLAKPVACYDLDLRLDAQYLARPGPVPQADVAPAAPLGGWRQGANVVAGTVSTVLQGETLRFTAVDGGTMNNQPLEFARRVLAGPLGRNPRGGLEANRALILIDPFPAVKEPDPSLSDRVEQKPVGILDVLPRLLSAYANQARYDANDLSIATNPEVYSRFMLSPMRALPDGSTATGRKALASGGLNAFAGFLSESFRHHDFLLGRRNAENFLRNYFALPAGNPLFRAGEAFWAKHGGRDDPTGPFWTITGSQHPTRPGDTLHERLIIPVLVPEEEWTHHQPARGVLDAEQRKWAVRARLPPGGPVWPGGSAVVPGLLRELDPLIRARAAALADIAIARLPGWLFRTAARLFRGRLVGPATNGVLGTIETALKAAGLDRESPPPRRLHH
jgi:hypothetical protein